jgi:hypothetical protein
MDGHPYALNKKVARQPAIVECWFRPALTAAPGDAMKRNLVAAGALLALLAMGAAAAEQAQSNRLVTGKLIYVAPMPGNLDRWLMDDLRIWGKYQVTANPEGVDLEIRASVPEKEPQYVLRQGVPHPKKESKEKPQETSIEVVDWVTGQRLWSAALADKKSDRNQSQAAPGSSIEIPARGFTPDQLALKLTSELRRYVEQLANSPHP